MNQLTAAKSGTVGAAPAGLEERLNWLCKFGEPRVRRMNDGWYAVIEMNTNTTGAKFQIDTDFRVSTPSGAVAQLIDRMLVALSALKVAA